MSQQRINIFFYFACLLLIIASMQAAATLEAEVDAYVISEGESLQLTISIDRQIFAANPDFFSHRKRLRYHQHQPEQPDPYSERSNHFTDHMDSDNPAKKNRQPYYTRYQAEKRKVETDQHKSTKDGCNPNKPKNGACFYRSKPGYR